MTEEKAPYGYCTNCAEPFDRPYTHCPFCNAVNPHFEQDLEKNKIYTEEKLRAQMEANRQWVDNNRAEVTAEVDARIEQNLQEMKQAVRNPSSFTKSQKKTTAVTQVKSTPVVNPEDNLGYAFGMKPGNTGAKGNSSCLLWALLAVGGVILLGVGLFLLLH